MGMQQLAECFLKDADSHVTDFLMDVSENFQLCSLYQNGGFLFVCLFFL